MRTARTPKWDILLAAVVTVDAAVGARTRCRLNTSWWSADVATAEEAEDYFAWLDSRFQRRSLLSNLPSRPTWKVPRCTVNRKLDSRSLCPACRHRHSAASPDCDWHCSDSYRDVLDFGAV